jgi:AraC family transcriptional regulator of adaptative response/methylated-DNA-[protein]-cysteine methyltransferase
MSREFSFVPASWYDWVHDMKKSSTPPDIRYGIYTSPFGKYLLATFHGEVCTLAFLGKGGEREALGDMKKDLHGATIVRDQKHAGTFAKKIFATQKNKASVPFILHGTDFQIKVWDALCTIPSGTTATYADIAKKIGAPKAVRAVGTACGKNAVAYLVPCHRVLTSTGAVGGYRWGVPRKKALLAWEASRA